MVIAFNCYLNKYRVRTCDVFGIQILVEYIDVYLIIHFHTTVTGPIIEMRCGTNAIYCT